MLNTPWMAVVENILVSALDCESTFVTCLILYFLNRILFLEKYTKRQEQRIKRLFVCYGIFALFYFLQSIVMSILLKYAAASMADPATANSAFALGFMDFYDGFYKKIIALLFDLNVLFAYVIILYVVITGRTKHKWLGIFSGIILLGYNEMIDTVMEIPVYFLNKVSGVLGSIYQIAAYLVLLAVFFRLNSQKHPPAFMQRIDEEAQSRSLSFREEAGIWLIGLWLLFSDYLVPDLSYRDSTGTDMMAALPDGAVIYLGISNAILAIVVTAMIIGGSYRRLYYEKNTKLQKSLIHTMANLVESRDDNTGGHIRRTAKYVEIIAKRLQKEGKFADILTNQYIADMIVAAPLHDVGKIHISDVILNKPGKLDAEEFATMKTHSAAGGEIIEHVEEEVGETISYLSIAKEMAEYHHERMNGTGYPHGLRGEEIPVCARILAVADVFDALISKRCYKDAMPLEKAFAIIKEGTGEQFDGNVVSAFLSAREEIEQYLKESAESFNAEGEPEAV